MFSVQTEESVIKRIDFIEKRLFSFGYKSYEKEFSNLPHTFMMAVQMGEYAIFPDIFSQPYLMVSEMVMQVMKLYQMEPFYRKVILSDENSEQYKAYFLLYFDRQAVLLHRDFIYEWTPEYKINCMISLDFAESILRRGAQGIQLKEIKTEDR